MHCAGVLQFQGSLQSEKIIDRKASLQNPVSSGGAAEEIYDCSLKESSNHLSAVASGEVRTGIRIRHLQRQNQPCMENSVT